MNLEKAAHELLRDPAILQRFLELARALGIVGEADTLCTLYLVVTSRLVLSGRLHASLGEVSAAGKSEVATFVLSTLPSTVVLHLGGGASKRAFQYAGDLSRMVVFIDEAGELTEDVRAQLRESMTKPEVTRLVTEGDFATRFKATPFTVKTEGLVVIQAGTKVIANPADETRMLSLHPDTSNEQTGRILDMQAKLAATFTPLLASELEVWRKAQELLKPCHVVVPYAAALRRFFPSDSLRVRRDFPRVLSLVRAHACLHQHQRTSGEQGGHLVITAEFDDYRRVCEFAAPLFAQATKRLTPTQEKVVKALLDHVSLGGKFPTKPTEFTTQQAHEWAGTPYSTVRDHLLALESLGLLESGMTQGRRVWRFIADTPPGLELPPPEELANALRPQTPQTPPGGASKPGGAPESLAEPVPVSVPQAPQSPRSAGEVKWQMDL